MLKSIKHRHYDHLPVFTNIQRHGYDLLRRKPDLLRWRAQNEFKDVQHTHKYYINIHMSPATTWSPTQRTDIVSPWRSSGRGSSYCSRSLINVDI